ncbi:MAG: hypothetical protein QG559_412 [Campylobacterota bacterium]|nr:hypothetical protein [Campylobacterota bacterium]
MNLLQIYLRVVLLFCISAVSLFAEDKSIEILAPFDKHLQKELTVNVVMKFDKKNFDTIKISTPAQMLELNVSSSKSTECKNVSLKLGENIIIIGGYKNGLLVDEKKRTVYVESQLYHQFKYPPQKFVKTYFHNEKNEKICAQCHDMSVNEVKGVAFADVTKSNCYTCHKSINKEKYGHAPSTNYLCTSCHNESNAESKYITKEPSNESCFECHDENKELWGSAKYGHEPLDSGNCTRCHNPHSSPYSMFTRKSVNDICIGCHKDKSVEAMNGSKSACNGAKNNKVCTECHTPHASNQPFFLKKISSEVKK